MLNKILPRTIIWPKGFYHALRVLGLPLRLPNWISPIKPINGYTINSPLPKKTRLVRGMTKNTIWRRNTLNQCVTSRSHIHVRPNRIWQRLRCWTSHMTISLSLPIVSTTWHRLSTLMFVLVIHATCSISSSIIPTQHYCNSRYQLPKSKHGCYTSP